MADDFAQTIKGEFPESTSITSTDQLIPIAVKGASGSDYVLPRIGDNGGLKVDVVDASGITVDVNLNESSDSVQIYGNDGGTNRAILTAADGSVSINDGGNVITIDGTLTGITNDVNIADGGNSITVDALNLDIRDLTSASDSVEVLQSTAASLNATVVASQLDIDDLNSTDDEVGIGDGTNSLDLVVVNSAFGATPTVMPLAGKYEATPTTYDDGDAVPLLTDAEGRLQVDVITQPGSISPSALDHGSANLVKDTSTLVNNFQASGAAKQINRVIVSGAGQCVWRLYVGAAGTDSDTLYAAFWTTPSHPTETLEMHGYDLTTSDYISVYGENKENKASPASDFTGYATIIAE